MIVVKISINSNFPIERQLPLEFEDTEGVRFVINKEIEECDYWLVYDNLSTKESVRCPIENTILITGEPATVRCYNKGFINQFKTLITTQKGLKHPNKIYMQPSLPWLVGVEYDKNLKEFKNDVYWKYEDFRDKDFYKDKTQLISLISSNKGFTKGHQQRVKFIKVLKEVLGDQLDLYGNGYLPIPDKLDSLKNYKYAIVIENSELPNYWTEKLADAMICECIPIYHGCTNVDQYFGNKGMVRININNPTVAVEKILKTINSNMFYEEKQEILVNKSKILNNYNLFNVISAMVRKDNKVYLKQNVTILPEQFSFFDKVETYFRRYN